MISTILAVTLVKFLDPIFFVMALAITYWVRGLKGIAIAGFVLAIVNVFLANGNQFWMFISALVAMTTQATIAFFMYRYLRKRRVIQEPNAATKE